MKKLVLEEDDCSPDAREYFEKNFLEMFGMEFSDFIIESSKTITDEGMQYNYELDNLLVIFRGNERVHSVYKITEDE